MYFTTKLSSLLSIVAASSASAQAIITARVRFNLCLMYCCFLLTITFTIPQNELAEVSAVFFSNVNLTGASFSPNNLVQGVCNTLPCCWLDRAESILIGPGYACTFFVCVPVSLKSLLVWYNWSPGLLGMRGAKVMGPLFPEKLIRFPSYPFLTTSNLSSAINKFLRRAVIY